MPAPLSPNRAGAQAWLDAGVPILPVVMRGKDKVPTCKWRPVTEDGKTRRPLTLMEAEAAWRLRGARDAMPGLDCQAIGAIVGDLDARNGGTLNFEALCREHRIDFGDCPMVKTPTGGVHLFFADPDGRWRNSVGKIAPGVDTRGVGGYVVAAGSLRRGVGTYEPVRPSSLTEFIALLAGGRLPPAPSAMANLLDAYCLPGAFPRGRPQGRA